jgi:hypothetical protein
MSKYEWRRVRSRDSYAMILGIGLITLAVIGAPDTPPLFAPCPNADWRTVTSFFVVLALAFGFVEGLNWVGWLITQNLARPASFEVPRSESERHFGDLLIPRGWTGLGLGIGLLVVAYAMHGPSPCQTFHFANVSFRDVAGALTLAYGLLVISQTGRNIDWKPSPPRTE